MTDHRIAEQITQERRVLRSHPDDRRIIGQSRLVPLTGVEDTVGRVPFVDQIRFRRWIDRMPPHMTEELLERGSPDEIQALLPELWRTVTVRLDGRLRRGRRLLCFPRRRGRWVERFR